MISMVYMQHLWHAQVKGQATDWKYNLKVKEQGNSCDTALFFPMDDINGATIATNWSNHRDHFTKIGLKWNGRFQVLSMHLVQTGKLIPKFENMQLKRCMFHHINEYLYFQLKNRSTWLDAPWNWNALEWCQLNATLVMHLVTPFSCVSMSINTRPILVTSRSVVKLTITNNAHQSAHHEHNSCTLSTTVEVWKWGRICLEGEGCVWTRENGIPCIKLTFS